MRNHRTRKILTKRLGKICGNVSKGFTKTNTKFERSAFERTLGKNLEGRKDQRSRDPKKFGLTK